jgi:hypothetical protein
MKVIRVCQALALATMLVVSPRVAAAQDAANPHARSRFWFNGGLGYGSLGCSDCSGREGGFTGNLTFGGTLSPKVLLGGSSNGWTKSEDGVTITAGALTALIRFYPSATGGFYVIGGLGLGTLSIDTSFGDASETGTAAILGLGYDFRVGDNVSLSPFLNGVGASFDGGDVNFNQLGLSVTVH